MDVAPNARPPLSTADARAVARLIVDTADGSTLAKQSARLMRDFPTTAWGDPFARALFDARVD